MRPPDDLIAAIATPIGEGGIAVIRLSGAGALPAADRFFQGRKRLAGAPSHTLHTGLFVGADGLAIDEVVAAVFKGPHSYTGEDVVEFSCHGGLLLSRKILFELTSGCAREAEPGEFTRRAFLNGRIDLSQAEAVAGMIHARSELYLRASFTQLQGRLSGKIADMRDVLLRICGLLEIELDFAEENAIFIQRSEIEREIQSALDTCRQLIDGYNIGRIYRDGIKIVLIGRPNVGKSSILNSLLNANRAIVTDVPGTTRDTLEESLKINGVACRLIDTAGIRESTDVVEREGVRRTVLEIEQADIILLVVSAKELDEEPWAEVGKTVGNIIDNPLRKIILVVNKIDLLEGSISPELGASLGTPVLLSAKTGHGMDALRSAIFDHAIGTNFSTQEADQVITNERHLNCLRRAVGFLEHGLGALRSSLSEEFVAVDIRSATDALGEIVGAVRTDEILDAIFSRFCIGK